MALPDTSSLPNSANVKARWLCDENGGTRADSVGSNNATDNNTVLGGTGLSVANASADYSADFEKDNAEYLSVAHNAAIAVVNGWSVAFWQKMESGQLGYWIGVKSGENGWAVTPQNTSGSIYVARPAAGSGTFDGANGTTNINDGAWHHICVYFNGSTSKLYVDGVDDGAVSLYNISNPSATMTIGKKPDSAHYYDGLMQDVIIWNTQITAAQALELYELYTVAGGVFNQQSVIIT